MNIIENAEKECAILGSLFQGIVNEMKVSIFTYHNIQLLTICQWNKKIKLIQHMFSENTIELRRPLNIKVLIIIMHISISNSSFYSIEYNNYYVIFRIVQQYGKIWHQKQIKCMFNWSKSMT